MAKKAKEPAGKGPDKGPEGGKASKKGKAKGPKVKGALLGKVTNLVAVLFGLSLVAERVAALAVGG